MANPNSKLTKFNLSNYDGELKAFKSRVKGTPRQRQYKIADNYVFSKNDIDALFSNKPNAVQLELFFTIENDELKVYIQAQGDGGGGDPGGSAARSPQI